MLDKDIHLILPYIIYIFILIYEAVRE